MIITILTGLTQALVVGGVTFGVLTEVVEPTVIAAYDRGTELYQTYVVGTE
jgi:hypothetical protein